ncbi:hypothetical protein FOZ62_000528, partial [Perkinsus olseni]
NADSMRSALDDTGSELEQQRLQREGEQCGRMQHHHLNKELHSNTSVGAAAPPLYGARGNLERRRSVLSLMKAKSADCEGRSSGLSDGMREETMDLVNNRGRRVSVAQINKIIKCHSGLTRSEGRNENTDINARKRTPDEHGYIIDDQKNITAHPTMSKVTTLPGQALGPNPHRGDADMSRIGGNKGTCFAVEVVAEVSPTPGSDAVKVHDTTKEGLMVPRTSIVIQNPTYLPSVKPKRSPFSRICSVQ